MSSPCSFRITRTAEDLAQTITALSQRLVKLEQRFEAIELKLNQSFQEPPLEELQMLDGVDRLLRECNELLGDSIKGMDSDESWSAEQQQDYENLAA